MNNTDLANLVLGVCFVAGFLYLFFRWTLSETTDIDDIKFKEDPPETP